MVIYSMSDGPKTSLAHEGLNSSIKTPQFAEGESSWGYNQAEMVPWIYQGQYRNVKLKVIEIDHVKTKQLPGEYDFPPHWRNVVENQIMKTDGTLVLEYFEPELENTVYKTPILGPVAREKGDVEHVTPFFGYAAKVCGREGKVVDTADPNLSPGTFLLQRANLFLAHSIPNWLKGKTFDQSLTDYYGEPHLESLEGIENIISVDDARRLYTARAVLELAIENQNSSKSVSLITAPVHAERINYYIGRQKQHEDATATQPQDPKDLLKCSPDIEIKKMSIYSKLMRPILREYKPVLPRTAFELDIVVNDFGREGYADTEYQHNIFDKDHLLKIKEAGELLLLDETKPAPNTGKYKNQVREVTLPLVDKLLGNIEQDIDHDPTDLKSLEKSVSTHKTGWEKVRSIKIN